jgi:hypothetical protein
VGIAAPHPLLAISSSVNTQSSAHGTGGYTVTATRFWHASPDDTHVRDDSMFFPTWSIFFFYFQC